MGFREERGIGYCGLACVMCSHEDCPGCVAIVANGHECSLAKCAVDKGGEGCHVCADCPCGEAMLQNKRIGVFNRYAREFGKQALINRLRINYENGITYHRPDNVSGDYDVLETEEEIYRLLRYGTSDPYIKCPVLETGSFILRLVKEDDIEDLLVCYSDPKSQAIFDSENLKSNLHYKKIEEMAECVRFWITEYNQRVYVRFAVVDKKIQKPIGTVEMFNAKGFLHDYDGGILRIDLASTYETEEYLSELLQIADNDFYHLFGAEMFITKGRPMESSRINALASVGYKPYDSQSKNREHYFYKKK